MQHEEMGYHVNYALQISIDAIDFLGSFFCVIDVMF